MLRTVYCVLLLLFAPLALLPAAVYHVSPSGSDANSGTAPGLAWRTFRHAACRLRPGDSLKIMAGNYRETLFIEKSGTSRAPIKISAFQNDVVTINVSGLGGCAVHVAGHDIQLSGLQVSGSDGVGVLLTGSHIRAENLLVSHVESHGILAGGQDITVKNCEVHHAVQENHPPNLSGSGWGSGLKVERGAARVVLENNYSHENYGEGLAVTMGEAVRVRGNVLSDNFSVNLYIDNSRDVTVERNFCLNHPGKSEFYRMDKDGRLHPANGISLAEEAESPWYEDWGARLQNVTVKNNIVVFGHYGLSWWGSDWADGNGGLKNVRILNNTVWGCSAGAVYLDSVNSQKTRRTVVANNIFHGMDNKRVWVESRKGIDMHHNFWVGEMPPEWTHVRGKNDVSGDAGFAETPGCDAQSFRPGESSLVIDKGDSTLSVTDDFFGRKRPEGQGVDMGAVEFSGGVSGCP